MTEETGGRSRREPDDDRRDADEEQLEDVDHTHPDTDESFTETGVYDRGKKQSSEEE